MECKTERKPIARIGMYGGSFNPLHNGHVHCIKRALTYVKELHLIIGELPNRDDFTIDVKLSWFETVFQTELTEGRLILHTLKDESVVKEDYTIDKWMSDSEKIKKMIGKHIDIVFAGSDYQYNGNPYEVCYPESLIYYFPREDKPISSSLFKSDIDKYHEDVPECVYHIYQKAEQLKKENQNGKLIVGMTFPRQDLHLGLEPSLLTVLPEGEHVVYNMENNHIYQDEDVLFYLCSVYITGAEEFRNWALRHDKSKIVVGGYEPTMNPEDFISYAGHILTGPCDDFFHSIANPKQIKTCITNYKKIPRYDLYDITCNQQIIPDKLEHDICTSVNTSQGCPFRCDFCCSPLMCDHIISKPIDALQKEIDYLKQYHPKFIFIRDENFPLQKDWKEKLKVIAQLQAKIYLFASSNLCTEETVKYMASQGVYMICLGLEDVLKEYKKNKELSETCQLLHKYGIYVYLSFIVNPLMVTTKEESEHYYSLLDKRLKELKPEMICGNFLMPFRGTPLWEQYKHMVTKEDEKEYNSKSAFLVKDKVIRKEIEYQMYKYQDDFYHSEFYQNEIRCFNEEDTLGLRFQELKNKEFKDYQSIWRV